MSTRAFDVRDYARTPGELRPTDLDLGAVADLPAQVRRTLAHLWSTERTLLDLMRDLLVTPTHAEARVTAFLTTWAYEQYWIAQSIGAVLDVNDGAGEGPPDTPLGRVRRGWDERARPTVDAIRTNLLGSEVVAAHMSTGWLNTAVMDLAYRRIGHMEPRLRNVTDAVAGIKARHLEFYADEAQVRLAASAGARRRAARTVRRWTWPGVRYGGLAAARPVVVHLFADPSARPGVRAVDAGVAALPGLGQSAPLRTALGQFLR
ncbi:hypothetical protein [Ruania halotolerans]|uniref:hypothetical protein n=1 Tax=Ruania halotolerans TaxID=2897773 RepID=UPI001E384929|nr:hypothetical protein [Ruania halotolerans]UFU06685.1 hypothetical protein LQF10_00805 [Ruania halotolerans]